MKSIVPGWTKQSGEDVTSFYPREHLPVLEKAGLEEVVLDPDSILENEIVINRISTGGRGRVYEVEGTGIVIKKHFPTFYYPSEKINRRNSRAAIEANLNVNVTFEKALRKDRDYTTPLYLGHLVLKDPVQHRDWSYTLMTELDILDRGDLSPTERRRFMCLCAVARWHCLEALARHNLPTNDIRWAEAMPYYNLVPVYEDDNIKTAVIDIESTQAQYPIANYDPARWRWNDPWIGNI